MQFANASVATNNVALAFMYRIEPSLKKKVA
jgi:hypothetical protein